VNHSHLQADGVRSPVQVEFDNFEHGFPEGFWPRRLGPSGLPHRHRVCVVPVSWSRQWNVFRAMWCARPRRLPDPDDLRLIGNLPPERFRPRVGWLYRCLSDSCAGSISGSSMPTDRARRRSDNTDLALGALLADADFFEGTRRLMGLATAAVLCGACRCTVLGQYLCAPFHHRGYDFDQIMHPSSYARKGFTACRSMCRRAYISVHPFCSFTSNARRHDPAVHAMCRSACSTAPSGGPAKVRGVCVGQDGARSGLRPPHPASPMSSTVGQFSRSP